MGKIIFIFLFISACGMHETKSHMKESMDWLNNPNNLPSADSTLIANHKELPDSGSVEKPVWDTYWYPASQNGTARREGRYSPMEKYDMAVGDISRQATNWELRQSGYFRNVSWAGHCNGVAAAGTMADEPKHGVTYNNVYFSNEDIKALLVEAWQSGGVAVGGRCNSQSIKYDPSGRMLDALCRDMNAASFHIIITNFIGIFHKPVIVDYDSGYAVWNYPIVSYEVKLKKDISIRDANWWLLGIDKEVYDYNPDAKAWVYYQTDMVLKNGTRKTYEYILELDSEGSIIGGEWYRDSKGDHPDFLWRHTIPTPENPYLKVDVIDEIHRQSLI